MAFTEEEAAYLRSQSLARIATVGPDGQPDVAPVGFEFDGTYLYVGGRAPERTRKFLNVKAGQAKVALVIDDLVSTDPLNFTDTKPLDQSIAADLRRNPRYHIIDVVPYGLARGTYVIWRYEPRS